MTPHLTEDQLDRLLDSTAATLPEGATEAARALVVPARDAVGPEVRRRTAGVGRRRLLAATAGVALLCGAGTTAAFQLSIPPFQTVPDGLTRVRPPIVAEFDTGVGLDGRRRCLVFPEFYGLSPRQAAGAAAWAGRQDWSGYGDRIVASGPDVLPSDREDYVVEQVGRDLRSELASQIVPGVELDGAVGLAQGRPTLTGYAMTCEAVRNDG